MFSRDSTETVKLAAWSALTMAGPRLPPALLEVSEQFLPESHSGKLLRRAYPSDDDLLDG